MTGVQTCALPISVGETDARIAALGEAARAPDAALAGFVQALLDDAVKLTPQAVLVVEGTAVKDAVSGAVATLPDDAEDVVNNNRMRGALQAVQASMKLLSPELAVRQAAVAELAKAGVDESQLPLLEQAVQAEPDAALKATLERLRAGVRLASTDKAQRLAAVQVLAASGEPTVKALLQDRLQVETEPEVKGALIGAIDRVGARLAWGERLGVVFTGISLGSILLLGALGLAITYGLMGVINMAHGELMMIGAYAT